MTEKIIKELGERISKERRFVDNILSSAKRNLENENETINTLLSSLEILGHNSQELEYQYKKIVTQYLEYSEDKLKEFTEMLKQRIIDNEPVRAYNFYHESGKVIRIDINKEEHN